MARARASSRSGRRVPGAENVSLSIDDEALIEAAAVLAHWRHRGEELPAHLRREIDRLAGRMDLIAEVVLRGRVLVVEPKPDFLALLANLRAQEAGRGR